MMSWIAKIPKKNQNNRKKIITRRTNIIADLVIVIIIQEGKGRTIIIDRIIIIQSIKMDRIFINIKVKTIDKKIAVTSNLNKKNKFLTDYLKRLKILFHLII